MSRARRVACRPSVGSRGRRLEIRLADFRHISGKAAGEDKAAVVFGCWTSVSRKHVLPVFEKYNGLLIYPVQYEGQEQSPNVVYTGATPNQQAIPAVEYLMSADGGSVKRFYLAARLCLSAHDQRYPGQFPEVQGRRRKRHHCQLHSVRSSGLGEDCYGNQGFRIQGQEDGGCFYSQWRRQYRLLQGTGEAGNHRLSDSRRGLLGRRG